MYATAMLKKRLNEWIRHSSNKICFVMHWENVWQCGMYKENFGATIVFMSPWVSTQWFPRLRQVILSYNIVFVVKGHVIEGLGFPS